MDIASLSLIKKELSEKPNKELIACCMRLAKYKKENKELLNYLLFEAYDEENFKRNLMNEVEILFAEINKNSLYYVKKSLRKILRYINKHIRYSGLKQTELELRLFFCLQFRKLNIAFHESKVLLNMYDRQLTNIQKAMNTLDEDLQFDYKYEFDALKKPLPGVSA